MEGLCFFFERSVGNPKVWYNKTIHFALRRSIGFTYPILKKQGGCLCINQTIKK